MLEEEVHRKRTDWFSEKFSLKSNLVPETDDFQEMFVQWCWRGTIENVYHLRTINKRV